MTISLAQLIDHTLLKPDATKEQILALCLEAKKFQFASVCVNPIYVALAAKQLKATNVKVCAVVGFPLGATTTTVKVVEARQAIDEGASEIDMVMNISALKSGDPESVYQDILGVRKATEGKILKVILETTLLTEQEKVLACQLAKKAKADFVKTSTGFGPGSGATVADIKLMRKTVGPEMGVKASGGIRDAISADQMIRAGANRLGTSSGVAIVAGKSKTLKTVPY